MILPSSHQLPLAPQPEAGLLRLSPIRPAILDGGHIFSRIPCYHLTFSPHLLPYLCVSESTGLATALGPTVTQNALLLTAKTLLQIRASSESGWAQTFGDRNQCSTDQVSGIWIPDSSLLSKFNHTLSLRCREIGGLLKFFICRRSGLTRIGVTGNQKNF